MGTSHGVASSPGVATDRLSCQRQKPLIRRLSGLRFLFTGLLLVAGFTIAAGVLSSFSLRGKTLFRPGDWKTRQASLEDTNPVTAVPAARGEALALIGELEGYFSDEPEALFVCGLIESRFGDRVRAVQLWRRVLQLVPEYPDVYVALGEEARLRGRTEEALKYFRKAAELAPERADVFLSLGRLLVDEGKNAEAIAALSQHVFLSPFSLEGWYRLALALQAEGRLGEAKAALLEAWRLDPTHRAVLFSLGEVCDKLGERGEAAKFRREFAAQEAALRLDPEQRKSWYDDIRAAREALAAAHVAVGHFFAARDDLARAEEHWLRAAEVDSANVPARMALLERCAQRSAWSEALRWVTDLEMLQPRHIEWPLRHAAILVQLGRIEEAEQLFRKVTELAPHRPEGFVGLAQLAIFRHRDPAGAREHARRAVACEPSAANYHLLATICERLGSLEEAITGATRAVELQPSNPDYRMALDRLHEKWREAQSAKEEPK